LGETDDLFVDFGDEFLQRSGLVRSLTEKHLIKDDSHRPHIALGWVGTSVEDFRTHVHGTAHERLMNLVQFCSLLIVLSKAEVRDLIGLVLDQDVRGLEISMNNRMLMEILVPPDKLLHNEKTLWFRHLLSLLQNLLKGSPIAQFLEEVDVVSWFLDVVEFDNIFILDGLHDLDLIFQRIVKFLRVLLDIGSADGLHGHQIASTDVCALVDLSIGTTAYLFVDVDDERLDELVIGCAQFGRLLLYLRHLRFLHWPDRARVIIIPRGWQPVYLSGITKNWTGGEKDPVMGKGGEKGGKGGEGREKEEI
jgi:hypothetical protein